MIIHRYIKVNIDIEKFIQFYSGFILDIMNISVN